MKTFSAQRAPIKIGFRITDYGPTLNFRWRGRLATIVWERLGQGYTFRPWFKKTSYLHDFFMVAPVLHNRQF